MANDGIINSGSGTVVVEGCAVGNGAKIVIVNDKVVESSTDQE